MYPPGSERRSASISARHTPEKRRKQGGESCSHAAVKHGSAHSSAIGHTHTHTHTHPGAALQSHPLDPTLSVETFSRTIFLFTSLWMCEYSYTDARDETIASHHSTVSLIKLFVKPPPLK